VVVVLVVVVVGVVVLAVAGSVDASAANVVDADEAVSALDATTRSPRTTINAITRPAVSARSAERTADRAIARS